MQITQKKSLVLQILFLLVAGMLMSGCAPEETSSSSGGSGTVMGCTPATGCYPPTSWNGGGFCYSSSSACNNDGNSFCRQCY